MKAIRVVVLAVTFGVPWLVLPDVWAEDVWVGVEINSANDFYEPLSAQGSWEEVGSYGRCWHPYAVDVSWRPYCEGTWVWTDDGWYWQSDEPWGWACYHYGRWAYDPYYGWVWAPDTVWGPSWVCFREGGGYCGWAPLPPGVAFGFGGELVIGVIPEPWFVFVGERHFGERIHTRNVIINNTTIINQTRINTRIRKENNRVITEGPRVQDLQRVNHERIQTSTVQAMRQREKIPPAVHRTAPQQPGIQRQNERQIERPATEPQRGNPRNNPPEIIRGRPNAPEPSPSERQQQQRYQTLPAERPQRNEPPPVERQQRNEPPPAERPQGNGPPVERRGPPEQRPSEPPHGEKVAPPPQREKPPPQEQRGEQHEEHGQQRDGEQPGR